MILTLILDEADMVVLLTRAVPRASDAIEYGPALLQTALAYNINTPLRAAHFLGQLLHESGRLQYTEELASGAAYEGVKMLGNTRPGDGKRFKGRGFIQLTGRANYTRYSRYKNDPSLLEDPDKLAKLPWAADSAGWFWRYGNGTDANNAADKDNLIAVTRIINGGLNGLEDRRTNTRIMKNTLDYVGTCKVQKALNAMNTYPGLHVDGDYGPRTASVVREMQSDFLLPPTGSIDRDTWNRLKAYSGGTNGQ